jgi:hypothetical protein
MLFFKNEYHMLNIFINIPLLHPENTLQLFTLLHFLISKGHRPNSTKIPKLEKDFFCSKCNTQIFTKKQLEIQSCKKYSMKDLCQG